MQFQPEIIFEDDELIVLNKPAGMVVNRADTVKDVQTLQDWIEEKFNVQGAKEKDTQNLIVDGYSKTEEFYNRSGIVHRLDKETSGAILVAKNVPSFINLQKQFKTSEVKKVYLALLHGNLVPSEGEINAPIGRLPWNRKRFGVIPSGREARTLYKVLSVKKSVEKNEDLSFVEVYPQTGRTHQIRVHFQYLNHPIFGDELYAGRKIARDDRKILTRHFLHAAKISFNHPASGLRMNLEAELSKELKDFLAKLG